MNILLLGATGFIGTNLVLSLAKDESNTITVIGKNRTHFLAIEKLKLPNVTFIESHLTMETDFASLVNNQEVVYHLISTTVPTTSNQHISEELKENVVLSSNLFDACVKKEVEKVVFLSSGGTVYGKEASCPLGEETPTNPISSYGIQKVTIEKLLYLYNYLYGMDYRIIRLSNPYGPYQRPNGVLGAVTTFTYKALKGEEITVYGDGSVVRDFIFIDDAIRGIINIVNGKNNFHTFNLGSGYGTSIRSVLSEIESTLGIKMDVVYKESRKVDVPTNFLDISRYESCYGALNPISLSEGVAKTAAFLKKEMF